jgi:plasmid stability protein
MSRMIQIRNVPDAVHRMLKARAALAGRSMSDYILDELRRALERPTRAELLRRVAQSSRTLLSESAASVLSEERETR